MKVLVVHDRIEVGDEIMEIVGATCDGVQVDFTEDALKARERLHGSYYDLLILDLTIPNVAGRRASTFQVAEGLLDELTSGSSMFVPGSILGITQDSAALDQVETSIGSHLMAVLDEDVDGHWRQHLVDRLKYVKYSSSAMANSFLTKHDLDLLILTALDKELEPFRKLFEFGVHNAIPGVETFFFTDRVGMVRRGAAFAIGRAGQPSAASETQGLLCQLRPRLAIMTGFCGGVPGKANLGDILFAEMAIDWDYGKWKPSESAARLYSRPEPISIRNSKIHRLARRIVEGGASNSDKLHSGMARLSNNEVVAPTIRLLPFASGSAVIGDEDILGSIKALNESVGGVDMESFGFYYAGRYSHSATPEFICIKAVADDCSRNKSDRLHSACCFGASLLAHDIAVNLWDYH